MDDNPFSFLFTPASQLWGGPLDITPDAAKAQAAGGMLGNMKQWMPNMGLLSAGQHLMSGSQNPFGGAAMLLMQDMQRDAAKKKKKKDDDDDDEPVKRSSRSAASGISSPITLPTTTMSYLGGLY